MDAPTDRIVVHPDVFLEIQRPAFANMTVIEDPEN